MAKLEADRPDIREQLVRGALKLIADEGPADLSVRRLAQAADRTTMCVYTKFSSRQGLLAAVYQRAGEELFQRLDEAKTAAAFADLYRQAVTDRPGIYEFLFELPLAAFGLNPATRAALVDEVTDRLRRLLDLDGLRPSEAVAVAQTTWATLHGLTVPYRLQSGDATSRTWTTRFRNVVAEPAKAR